jgi:hypothetical protein
MMVEDTTELVSTGESLVLFYQGKCFSSFTDIM